MRSNIKVIRDHLKKYGIEVDRVGDDDIIIIAELIVDLEEILGFSLIWPYDQIRLIE